jgi:predicted phage terminase large subunit-like protein
MSELLSLDAQAALRAAMRASLATFVARACREIEPSRLFVPSPHIDIVADHLERLHGGDLQRLIVNLPPRHLKSIVTSVCFVAWVLGHNPGFRFVLVSYGSDVVERHLRFIRQIMKADWYLQLFPATRISRRKDTNIEIETTAGGAVFATTIEGVLTGRGGDCFIVDDPIKASDSTHPNRLKSVNEWVSHTLINRLDSKARGRVVVVMQRLHMDDLSGHLLETGGWTHLSLPAIAQERESYTLTSGHTFLREEGEVLFRPETRAILERVRSEIGWPAFSAQYLQAPKPESGNLLQPEWLARYDALPEPHPADRIVQAWDLSIKDGDSNDYSACVTVLRSGRDKAYYVLYMWRGRLLFPPLQKMIIQLLQHHKANYVLIEEAALGPAMIQDLRHQGHHKVQGVKPKGDKTDRILAQSMLLESGQVRFPKSANWWNAFEDEYLAFPRGRHDDLLDALAYALERARKLNVEPGLVIAGRPSWMPPREVV